ncbi:hypothetical protein LCGC14_1255850 [marine sediment metagenome]|uniref:Uncharacterized protein n=1 Tax=marine sediment metagenome TaxID=412755 RepID=A0A0F9L222_9ZZZZ
MTVMAKISTSAVLVWKDDEVDLRIVKWQRRYSWFLHQLFKTDMSNGKRYASRKSAKRAGRRCARKLGLRITNPDG